SVSSQTAARSPTSSPEKVTAADEAFARPPEGFPAPATEEELTLSAEWSRALKRAAERLRSMAGRASAPGLSGARATRGATGRPRDEGATRARAIVPLGELGEPE